MSEFRREKMASVFVASRLPFGLIAEHPTSGQKIELKGIPRLESGQILTPYGETEVPKEFWDDWVAHNKDFDAIKNGVIFARGSSKDLAAQAKEYEGKDALTKLEPVAQKADGIKPAEEK